MKLTILLTLAIFVLLGPLVAFAQETAASPRCQPNDPLCVELTEPLGETTKITGTSGQDILVKYVGTIYVWGGSIIGIISVLILIFSGIQIATAAGDEQQVSTAKTRIFESLAGLALLFLSGLLLYLINPNFFVR